MRALLTRYRGAISAQPLARPVPEGLTRAAYDQMIADAEARLATMAARDQELLDALRAKGHEIHAAEATPNGIRRAALAFELLELTRRRDAAPTTPDHAAADAAHTTAEVHGGC